MSGGAGSEEDQEEDGEDEKQKIVVKVGMVGDAQIGERAMPSPRPACARKGRPIVTTAYKRLLTRSRVRVRANACCGVLLVRLQARPV